MALRASVLTVAAAYSAIFLSVPALAAGVPPRLHLAAISRELSDNPDDPFLNFVAGFAYEGSTTPSSEAREMAKIGYLTALRFDDGYWRAAYQLGLMALEDQDPLTAQRFLLVAATNARSEARVFSALARAAYCAGDIDLASAALDKARSLGATDSDDDLLTGALIASARGDNGLVELALPRLSPALQEALTNRLSSPRKLSAEAAAPAATQGASRLEGKRMAVVDAVIIRRNESGSTSSGLNLLDTLSLQFGGTLINRNWTKSTDRIDPSLSTNTISTDNNLQATIPAVTYSLNLANARGNTSRIEARPKLLVYDETEAKVFNGGTLTFATDGQLSSSSDTREVGLSLSVKPKFLSDDTVNLAVTVSLETFVPTNPAGTFRQAVQTEKSSTIVAADVRFGQTMLVSGGSSSTITRSRSKTPFVSNVPIIGRLFSTKSLTQQDNELLVLLSLRRVSGETTQRQSESEQKIMTALREQAFPKITNSTALTPETRKLFYRVENPAFARTSDYLSPIADRATLKRLSAHR